MSVHDEIFIPPPFTSQYRREAWSNQPKTLLQPSIIMHQPNESCDCLKISRKIRIQSHPIDQRPRSRCTRLTIPRTTIQNRRFAPNTSSPASQCLHRSQETNNGTPLTASHRLSSCASASPAKPFPGHDPALELDC